MAKFRRRNLEETLKLIKSYSSRTLKPTQFSQALGGKGSTESGAFTTNYADLNFYGLVKHLQNGDYQFTDICQDIKEERFPKQTKEGKFKAFLHSKLFKESIYRVYKGSPVEFNDKVIEEIADDIKKNVEFVEAAIEVFIQSGVYAGVVIRKPNNTVLIKDVDEIIGLPVKVEPTKDEAEETPDKPHVESTGRRRRITHDGLDPQISPLNFGINFTLDGSTTSEMAEKVFDFLREAGIGEKKKHQLELYVTEPPLKRELLVAVEKMILETEKEITIITPFLDNQVLNILIPRAKEGIKVVVITRTIQHTKGTEPKAAWKHLAEEPNINHQCCDELHSRMILKDRSVILVSSADISHDSLEGQFNAGILTNNPVIVKRGEAFIKALLKKSKKSKI